MSAHRVENPVGQLLPLQLRFDAQRRCRLSRAGIPVACELGLNPEKFGSLATEKRLPWRLPLRKFIAACGTAAARIGCMRAASGTVLASDAISFLVLTSKPAWRTTAASPGFARFWVLELRWNRALGLRDFRTARRRKVVYCNTMLLHQVPDFLNRAIDFIFVGCFSEGLQFSDLFNILCVRRYSVSKGIDDSKGLLIQA